MIKTLSLSFFERYNVYIYILLALNIVLILFFGLNPKSDNWSNTALVDEGSNLIFSRGAFAFVEVDNQDKNEFSKIGSGLVLDTIIKPYSGSLQSRNILRLSFKGAADNNIYIFQWKSNVIASFGRDYNFKKKLPRISGKLKKAKQNVKFKILNGSMKLYLDGYLVDEIRDISIRLPEKNSFRLKLGEYSSLRRSWFGEMSYLSVFLIDNFKVNTKPIIKYDFVANKVHKNDPESDIKNKLIIPENPIFFDREFLAFPGIDMKFNFLFFSDVFVNIAGFIPFGAFLMFFSLINKKNQFFSILCITVLGFIVSLSIEYAQSWMPVRSSSGLDLLLNTSGAMLGALAFYFLVSHDERC